MIAAYKKTLLDLFSKVQQLPVVPHQNAAISLEIQETLIRRITYVERKIRKTKSKIKEDRKELRTKRDIPLTKQEAELIKQDIESNLYKIDRYNELIIIFRSVGDAIAHTYINKWDIKPLVFKESPGFISGKKGNRLERQILRYSSKLGATTILNDLTNSLRYGDITVPSKDGNFLIVEVKSPKKNKKGRRLNQRVKRQMEAINKINSYLESDNTQDLFGVSGPFIRFSSSEKEENYIFKLNELIGQSLINHEAYDEVEAGLFYFVSTHSKIKTLEIIRQRCKEPIIGFAHMFKYETLGYYPFTLSIQNPLACYDFYLGKLVIAIVVDLARVKKQFRDYDIVAEFKADEQRPLKLSKQGLETPISIGSHLFNRVFVEFLSLRWLIDELANRFHSADSILAEFLADNPK